MYVQSCCFTNLNKTYGFYAVLVDVALIVA